jgi:ribulose-5-phosphate 4-epimerase/fuculose-1-phosphate aldolase
MTDLVFTHITAKLPGSNAFLINPYGMLFDEITASSLVKVDDKCNKLQVCCFEAASVFLVHCLQPSPYPVNPAGFNIHAAVHAARADAGERLLLEKIITAAHFLNPCQCACFTPTHVLVWQLLL